MADWLIFINTVLPYRYQGVSDKMKSPRRLNESDDQYRAYMFDKLVMILKIFALFGIVGEIAMIINLIINGFSEFDLGKLLIYILPAFIFICSVLILKKLKNINSK